MIFFPDLVPKDKYDKLSFIGKMFHILMESNHRVNIIKIFNLPMDFIYDKKNIKKIIGLPLLIWGGISILVAAFGLFSPSNLIKGVLLQAFFWGIIDAILGLGTVLFKKEFDLVKIKKILLINTYLDIGYIIIGVILILFFINSAFLIGNGIGVIIQGAFLFIVDLIHYINLKKSLK
ncbi:MAG: hypothetical protein EU550_00390 [Promethearchaeota archaeon]|nr:MAG: hypothetical protein EU550_00390 [Candidatus Lokiarchaeota archaeon]